MPVVKDGDGATKGVISREYSFVCESCRGYFDGYEYEGDAEAALDSHFEACVAGKSWDDGEWQK
jgi:hypothetical protein